MASRRRSTRRNAIAVATALAVAGLMLAPLPARAGSATITDPIRVDYDAACLVDTSIAPPPPNSYGGCSGITMYDGSTSTTDLTQLSLSSNSWGQFVATFVVQGPVPEPGDPSFFAGDLPNDLFRGVGYKAMFQNRSVQTNVPRYGCTRHGLGTPVFDQQGSWKDGYHFFIGFDASWDGLRWINTAKVGVYDPSPLGGFIFMELGVNEGSGWTSSDPYMTFGSDWSVTRSGNGPTTITVTVGGIVREASPFVCQEGFFRRHVGMSGEVIANVKALSTANVTATLPVTIPRSFLCGATGGLACDSDMRSVGGYVFFSDTTSGNSTSGILNTNTSGIAYTAGLAHPGAGEWVTWLTSVEPGRYGDGDTYGGGPSMPDTLGAGPTCPTPTFGGLFPPNPLFVPDTACHIDDDSVSRGSFLPEFWETSSGFVF